MQVHGGLGSSTSADCKDGAQTPNVKMARLLLRAGSARGVQVAKMANLHKQLESPDSRASSILHRGKCAADSDTFPSFYLSRIAPRGARVNARRAHRQKHAWSLNECDFDLAQMMPASAIERLQSYWPG